MRIYIILFTVLPFLVSCDFMKQDSCYDVGHQWDADNKICSDDCVRNGGIFNVKNKSCSIHSSAIEKDDLFNAVEETCGVLPGLIEQDLLISNLTNSGNVHALQYDYPSLAPIGYTDKYDYGQDGVCSYRTHDETLIKIYIRKNARMSSKYASGDFDVLRIERRPEGDEETEILWDRD